MHFVNFNVFSRALTESLNAIESGGAPPVPPHPGLAAELRRSIEQGDVDSFRRHALDSCAYLAQTMLSQSCLRTGADGAPTDAG